MGHMLRVQAIRWHDSHAGLLDWRARWGTRPRPGVHGTRRRRSQEGPGTPRCRRASPADGGLRREEAERLAWAGLQVPGVAP